MFYSEECNQQQFKQDDIKNDYNDEDIFLMSIRSPTRSIEQEQESKMIKKIIKETNFKRKLTKFTRKLLKKAVKFKFKKRKINVESKDVLQISEQSDDLYSDISSATSSAVTTRANSVDDPEQQQKHQIPSLLSLRLNIREFRQVKDNYTLNIYWNNLYLAFKLLTNDFLIIKNGLNDLKIIENYPNVSPNAYKQLENDIYKINSIENPCDPTDCNRNWVWNYKSSKHYKLIKIKYSLITRLLILHDYYTQNSSLTTKKAVNIVDCLKMYCLDRLNDYFKKWERGLNDRNERHDRIETDFYMLVRISSHRQAFKYLQQKKVVLDFSVHYLISVQIKL